MSETLPFYGDGKPVDGIEIIDINSKSVEVNGAQYQWSEALIPEGTSARTTGIAGNLVTIVDVDEERKAAIPSSSFGMIKPILLTEGALLADIDKQINGFTSDLLPVLKQSEGVLEDVDPLVFTRSNTHAGYFFLGQATYESELWLGRSLREFHTVAGRSIVATDSGALPSVENIQRGIEPRVFEYATPVPLYEGEPLYASITVGYSSKRNKYVTKLAPIDPSRIPEGDHLVGTVEFGNLIRDEITEAIKFDMISWSVMGLDVDTTSRQLVGLVMTSCGTIEQVPNTTDSNKLSKRQSRNDQTDGHRLGPVPKKSQVF